MAESLKNKTVKGVAWNRFYPPQSHRITSIDALRAFALLGILFVHARTGFGANVIGTSGSVLLNSLIVLFRGKCALIFNILFGISFYIILRKPDYPKRKFVWRCFLLTLMGLGTQFFYNSDALMWYGICGMFLVLVTPLSNKMIAAIIISLHALAMYLGTYHFGDYLLGSYTDISRYGEDISMKEFVALYPNGVLTYFKAVLNNGIFPTYANFCLGYLIGRLGVVESWDKKITFKTVLWAISIFLVVSGGSVAVHVLNGASLSAAFMAMLSSRLCNLAGATFYTVLFVWAYNHCTLLAPMFHKLEAYGKCGLTNYSLQGVVGVSVFFFLGFSHKIGSASYLFWGTILFYIIQVWCSNLWLRYFRNGPLEYLWRCSTECKWLPLNNKRT